MACACGANSVNDQQTEIEQLLNGARRSISGATTASRRPDCTSDEVSNHYNSVADAVNLIGKAFLRAQGYTDLSSKSAPTIVRDVLGVMRRLRIVDAPSHEDLMVLIYARNSSVHEGVASVSEVEQLQAVIDLANSYLAVIERLSRNAVH